jgi:drug/metabolite transporter (DMT)-like permease
MKINKTMLILVFISVFLGAMGQIAMKNGINGVEINAIIDLPKIVSNIYVWLGLSLYGVSAVFWLVALTRFDVSYMYPLVSMGYVLTAVFAYVFLHESIGVYRWLGILLIIGGVLLIVRN